MGITMDSERDDRVRQLHPSTSPHPRLHINLSPDPKHHYDYSHQMEELKREMDKNSLNSLHSPTTSKQREEEQTTLRALPSLPIQHNYSMDLPIKPSTTNSHAPMLLPIPLPILSDKYLYIYIYIIIIL